MSPSAVPGRERPLVLLQQMTSHQPHPPPAREIFTGAAHPTTTRAQCSLFTSDLQQGLIQHYHLTRSSPTHGHGQRPASHQHWAFLMGPHHPLGSHQAGSKPLLSTLGKLSPHPVTPREICPGTSTFARLRRQSLHPWQHHT